MLTVLNLAQLVVYIALLSLLGQGALYLLAGTRRAGNVFYRLLEVVAMPFTRLVRRITPAWVADHQVPIVTFLLLLVLYVVVTFEKIQWCVRAGMVGCR